MDVCTTIGEEQDSTNRMQGHQQMFIGGIKQFDRRNSNVSNDIKIWAKWQVSGVDYGQSNQQMTGVSLVEISW